MGSLLAQSNTRPQELGVSTAVRILFPISNIWVGISRNKKQKERDKFMNLLYNRGMSRTITMNHSDHWAVAKGLFELAKQYGDPVIQAINEIVPRTGGKLWSRHDSTYGQVDQIIRRAEELVQEEEDRKAREQAAEQEREEKRLEEQMRERQEQSSAQPPASQPAVPAAEGMMSNPYVIGGSILGAGTLLLLLLRG